MTRSADKTHAIAIVAVLCLVLGSASQAFGCNIPVFRYALENWVPDAYQVLIVSNGPLSSEHAALRGQLEQASNDEQHPANMQVHHVDVALDDLSDVLSSSASAGRVPPSVLARWVDQIRETAVEAPQLMVFYPQIWDQAAWQGPLTENNVQQVADSPVRQEIARRLLDGQSAVWVLLECSDQARNDKAWETLQQELKRSATVVELPSRDLIVADEQFQDDVEIDLRVEFSAIRIERDDDREDVLRAMLKSSEPDLVEFDEPMAIPVYGRGRTYFALVGAGINTDTIEENGHFICGACSCEVKRDNPGIDLLMAINWDGLIRGSVMSDVVLPELTGIGDLQLAAVPSTDGPTGADAVGHEGQGAAATGSEASVQPPADGAAGDAIATADDRDRTADAAILSTSTTDVPDSVDGRLPRRLLFGLIGGVGLTVCVLGFLSYWLASRGV